MQRSSIRTGNETPFDVAEEAYRHVLRNRAAFYGGAVETHDSTARSVTVGDMVQLNDPSRLDVDFVVRLVRAETEEEQAAWAAFDQAQTTTTVMDVAPFLSRK